MSDNCGRPWDRTPQWNHGVSMTRGFRWISSLQWIHGKYGGWAIPMMMQNIITITYEVFQSHGGTPSSHPFSWVFAWNKLNKPSSELCGYPNLWKPPYPHSNAECQGGWEHLGPRRTRPSCRRSPARRTRHVGAPGFPAFRGCGRMYPQRAPRVNTEKDVEKCWKPMAKPENHLLYFSTLAFFFGTSLYVYRRVLHSG